MFIAFSKSDFYAMTIEHDAERGTNFLWVQIDASRFPLEDAALTIGDALHNLRSALDHLWHRVVLACGGTPTNWTRFPIGNAGDSLIAALNGALEKKQITVPIVQFLLETIKSYQGGNPLLWGLHDLNIRDKHEILVPMLKLVGFFDVSLEDDQHHPIGRNYYLMDESSRIRLPDADDRTVIVKNKGHAAGTILFDVGTPFQGEGVIVTLKRISEEITRTIEAFEMLGLVIRSD